MSRVRAQDSVSGGSGTPPGDFRLGKGPLDIDEIESRDGYVDLGALLIAPAEGLQLRLEVEEATQRVVAVTMDLNGSSLQLQAFAAPRSEGLWDEIREQINQSVASQGGGETEEVSGAFGTELVAKLPAEATDGSRASVLPASWAWTGHDGSSVVSLAGRLPWNAMPQQVWKICSARSWWSVAIIRCLPPANCCSCACPRMLRYRARPALPKAPFPRKSPQCSSRSEGRRLPRLVDSSGHSGTSGQRPPPEQGVRDLPARGRAVCTGFIESVTHQPPSEQPFFSAVVVDT